MNIIEAVQSGKRFKRPKSEYFNKISFDSKEYYTITIDDLIAEDWEIEEEKVEITRAELNGIIWQARNEFKAKDHFSHDWFQMIYKRVGFKE